MNRVKKIKLLMFLLLITFVYSISIDMVDAADITCIYEGDTATYTFFVNSNDSGNVTYTADQEQKNGKDYMTYNLFFQDISSNNFVDTASNKLICPTDLYYKIEGRDPVRNITLNFDKFTGSSVEPLALSNSFTNSNTTLTPESEILNSCTYIGKHIVSGNVVSRVYIKLTRNGLAFEATNGYVISTVDSKINTSTFTENTDCSNFAVHVTCGNNGTYNYCVLAKDDNPSLGSGTSGTETPDAGDINGDNNSDEGSNINWGDKADVNCDGIIGTKLLDFINKIFRWIQIIAPIFVIIMGGVEFAGAVLQDDKDALKKASSKFIKRLIIAVVLFLIPLILSFVLDIFNEVSGAFTSTCGIGE